MVPGPSPEIPEPHAHAYYRYEDAGRQATVDVTRHNPSWICAGGDMISTTQDLHTFISALVGGALLPAPLLDYLRDHGRPIRYGYVPRAWPLSAYQTVYANEPGSAEMPSAGRPFTPELIAGLIARGVDVAPIVLHTGVSSLEHGEPPLVM